MSELLPLFPLQLVVFPGESLNLHIFEPRYRQLIQDAERDGTRFGVPTVIEGGLRPIATEVSLVEIAERYPSGESDVHTVGNRVFLIEEFHRELDGKLYPGAQINFLEVDYDEDPALNQEIVALTREIYQTLKIDKEVKDADAGFSTYDIAHYVGLTLDQEYQLLTLRNAQERQRYLIDHLQRVQPDVSDQLNIRARAKMNGHFKNLRPPNF